MNHIMEICVSTPEELKEAMSLSKYCFWRKSVISIHYNYGVEKLDVRFEKSIAILVIVFLARSLKNIQLIYLQNWERGIM